MKRKGRVYWICTTHIKTYYTVKIWLLAEDITHREFNLFFKKQDSSSALKLTFLNLGQSKIFWIISYYLLIAKKQLLV